MLPNFLHIHSYFLRCILEEPHMKALCSNKEKLQEFHKMSISKSNKHYSWLTTLINNFLQTPLYQTVFKVTFVKMIDNSIVESICDLGWGPWLLKDHRQNYMDSFQNPSDFAGSVNWSFTRNTDSAFIWWRTAETAIQKARMHQRNNRAIMKMVFFSISPDCTQLKKLNRTWNIMLMKIYRLGCKERKTPKSSKNVALDQENLRIVNTVDLNKLIFGKIYFKIIFNTNKTFSQVIICQWQLESEKIKHYLQKNIIHLRW